MQRKMSLVYVVRDSDYRQPVLFFLLFSGTLLCRRFFLNLP